MTRFCSDCRWVRGDGEFAKCASPRKPSNRVALLVERNISVEPANGYCAIERAQGWFDARCFRYCGREARWFEAKPLGDSVVARLRVGHGEEGVE